jgi:hypothetical protein
MIERALRFGASLLEIESIVALGFGSFRKTGIHPGSSPGQGFFRIML